MEIKFFRLVKTIAEEGNLANSSGKLFLTQSALSHQLRELEGQLGFKVFKRARNKWELTEEGQELYQLASRVLLEIDSGFRAIQEIRAGSKGRIKLSTECYSFYQDLPSIIQKMGILYPEIEVDLVLEATHQPISKLLQNEIDIALVTQHPVHEDLNCIQVYQDEIFALLHQENPLCKLEYLDPCHFAEQHLIIHSFPLETVSIYSQYLKPHHVHPPKISAIPLSEVALSLVQANMGLMCMPLWALKPFKLSDEIQFKRLGKQGFRRAHYLVIRKEDQSKKYIQDFLINFGEYLQEG